jgi:GH25 family lysozyme M1 (1,4-beta-N-acetylmuramidase)
VGVTVRSAFAAFLVATAALCSVGSVQGASYAKGLDVSNWQGQIDWLQVSDGGYSFAFAKATEGTTFSDVTYPFNRSSAPWLGVRLGAYHFARPAGSGDAAITASAIAQADHFVEIAQPKVGDLPPVLDLETTGGLSPAALATWTTAWLGEVAARTGLNAVIYASPSFWKTRLADTTSFATTGHPLWIAHWTKADTPSLPADGWAGKGWSFWQYTNCEAIPGIAHCADGDRANVPDPARFALPPFPTGAPAASTPPTIVGTARAGAQLTGVPGTWSGGKPVSFTYQWESCDAAGAGCAPIPGATLPTYVPGAGDVGHAVVLAVTAGGAAGTANALSSPTVAVGQAGSGTTTRPAAITAPQVTGTAQVGATLTATAGTWNGSPSAFAYQWRRCDATGSGCAALSGATAPSYVLTPGDQGSTISLAVTATGAGGSQTATAPSTAPVAAAPVPPAVAGSLVAQAGAAGAVATTDGRATVTWQPGAVPVGTTVSLTSTTAAPAIAGTEVALTLTPAQEALPWPMDIAYAAAPAGQVVGLSTDGKTWVALPALTTPALTGTLLAGTYMSGGVLHVLTRQAGRVALFRPGRWGDPRRISPHAPVLRRPAPLLVTRQRDGTVLLVTRLSTSSQAHLYAAVLPTAGVRPSIFKRGSQLAAPLGAGTTHTAQALVLKSGGFPVRLRLGGRGLVPRTLVRISVSALDPWGRRGAFTLSFRAP